jgi:D-tagatose-1,6-bisphosphate aldolase subunit GatZ/KbaZ
LFDQVIAVVVQPGVEFGDSTIHAYDRESAGELIRYMRGQPGLVLEGHSTDYQMTGHLQQMAEDGIGILKVGPALTFALREGLVALEHLEKALFPSAAADSLSQFSAILEQVMLRQPGYWKNHYHGDEDALRLARLFSLSDRCRYYLGVDEVAAAIDRLVDHLSGQPIPLPLLSQYLPEQYWLVRGGQLRPEPLELLKSKVRCEIGRYPAFRV